MEVSSSAKHRRFSGAQRPDLSKRTLLLLLTYTVLSFVVAICFVQHKPGEPGAQLAAIIGTLLLMVPMLFSLLKRSGLSKSPPLWFVCHVVCSTFGASLIFFYAAKGNWFTPPGMVLFTLIFLVLQGILSRAFISQSMSYLFARSLSSFNFTKRLNIDREQLQLVINKKVELLRKLDPKANEALFSPTLAHWLRSPINSLRYQWLIEKEFRLVGARRRAGITLSLWRRLHLLAAALFFLGLLPHLIVVLFFAGYAAGDGEIYWWYITDWG